MGFGLLEETQRDLPEKVELLSHDSEAGVLGDVDPKPGGHVAGVEQVFHLAADVRHLVGHLFNVLPILHTCNCQ